MNTASKNGEREKTRKKSDPPIIIKEEELVVGQLYRLDFNNLFIKCKDHIDDVSKEIRASHGHSMLLCEIVVQTATNPDEHEYKFLSGEKVQNFTYYQIGPWLRPASYKSGNKRYWAGPPSSEDTP